MVCILFFLFFFTCKGEIGCMDTSHHSLWCNDGSEICNKKDYKKLHYVPCTCPCNRYQRKRGVKKCVKCDHFYQPGYIDYTNHPQNDEVV